MSTTRCAVLGGGSWGTALAWMLGGRGHSVRLWCRDAEQANSIRGTQRNPRYLPDLTLAPAVEAMTDAREAVRGAEMVLVAVPVSALAEVLGEVRSAVGSPLVIAAKGLERSTGRRLSEVATSVLGGGATLAALSGPNLAGELVRGLPSAAVLACRESGVALRLQAILGTPFFRVYTSDDLPGVELAGALKNPIAIGAGISDGLGYGENTKAALLTRGLAEITRLGVAAGGRESTFRGLAGLGDLLATAHSPLSRNYRLGAALGTGDSLSHALEELHQTAEGVPSTEAACRLADRVGVDAPILRALRDVLAGTLPVREAVLALLSRPMRGEDA